MFWPLNVKKKKKVYVAVILDTGRQSCFVGRVDVERLVPTDTNS